MSMFGGIDASASGLTAERLRMDVISNNIANANTTRTAEGGAYRRRVVVFEPRSEAASSFAKTLSQEIAPKAGEGVRVRGIVADDAPGRATYNPGHPDADQNGYVMMPNLNIVSEMVDMITASRAYEANVTAINGAKSMAMKVLDIGK